MTHQERGEDDPIARLEKNVERIRVILEGTGDDTPGIVSRLALVERVLFGKEHQDQGLVYRVGVLWRMQTWVLCTLSGAAGFLLRELVRLIWKV